jgi:transcriptional regulator GlxA family with amidase domain
VTSGRGAIFDIIPAMGRVALLVLDGVFDLGMAVILDTLGTARELGDAVAGPGAVDVVGVRRRVRTAQGLAVPVAPPPRARPDVVVVAPLSAKTPEALRVALARPDVRDAGALLRRWAAGGTLVAAACTATFVVAEAGLLAGRRATTSWWLAPFFRDRYRDVELDDAAMLVAGDGVVTAGAALAHLDLALWLVRRRSPALAALAARYLLLEPRASQAAFAIPHHLAHADPLVERFELWARRHLDRRFSLAEAARGAGTSERTLTRRLRGVLGKSPLGYVRELRVERALHLLRTSDASVEEVAAKVGYGDGVTLRALLRGKLGRGVRELRRAG